MSQINVYVPDEMRDALKASGLPLSRLAQEAWAKALRDRRGEEVLSFLLGK